jgi:hypothetical protein
MKLIYCHEIQLTMRYLITFLLSLITSMSSMSQVPNASFENWTQVNGILKPDGWSTNNYAGNVSITQDTSSKDGQFALGIINNGPGIEPTEGIVYSYFKIPPGADTLYAYIKIKERMSASGFFYINLESRGLPQVEKRQIGISDTIIPHYEIIKIPLDFSQTPDSVYIEFMVGCTCFTNTSQVTVDALSFSPLMNAQHFQIDKNVRIFYPNPVREAINFDLPEDEKIVKLEILDLSGKEVLSPLPVQEQMELSFLPKGEYLLLIETNKSFYRRKFLKQ